MVLFVRGRRKIRWRSYVYYNEFREGRRVKFKGNELKGWYDKKKGKIRNERNGEYGGS